MQKNQKFIALCSDYSYHGFGVVLFESLPIFVKGLIKGEEAEIVITKISKRFGYGKIIRLIKTSNNRCSLSCTVAESCGGCCLQHLSYPAQLEFKEETVRQNLLSIAKIELACEVVIPAASPWRYRNKVQIPLSLQQGRLIGGFYQLNSHRIVEFDQCLLQSELLNQIFHYVLQLISKCQIAVSIKHLLFRVTTKTNELMLVLVLNDDRVVDYTSLIDQLIKVYPQVSTIAININLRNDNVILGDKTIVIYGCGYLYEDVLHKTYRISPHAFFQINLQQCERLYNQAIIFAQLNNNMRILDLYCGIGTIAISLADEVGSVIGVDIVKEAIEDADYNCQINNIKNASFIWGDAGTIAQSLNNYFDVIFVDPPRKGLDQATKQAIMKLKPSKLIYISCNPGTLARDIYDFRNVFKPTKLALVDMFPHTHHIECIVAFELIN